MEEIQVIELQTNISDQKKVFIFFKQKIDQY